MPRYIDVDALKWRYIPLTIQPEEFVTKSDVENAPTADVVERKRGKWIDPAAVDVYRCSVCEEYTKLEVPRLFYLYCPHCGAEMEANYGEIH